MTSRLHISTLIAIVVLLWMAGLWIYNLPFTKDYLLPYSLVVSGVILIITVFKNWIWAWPILQGWFVDRPDIRGTWEAELKSTYIDPVTNQITAPITCYVTVRQTLNTLSFRLMSDKSNSKILAHTFIKSEDGTYQMAGVYINTPKFEQRSILSQIHYGSVFLQINGAQPTSLEGHYWTDRNTCGSLTLTKKHNIVCYTYEEALLVFNPTGN